MPINKTLEAWEVRDDKTVDITFGSSESIKVARENGSLSEVAVLLHSITSDTYENAAIKHHELMGWGPYRPMGVATPCPNDCGADFYPEGSGECPNCGKVC